VTKIFEILECKDKEISLLLVDDDEIREFNRNYLGRDFPTNVMAFSLSEGEFGDINPDVLGDIVISMETAFRDARDGGLSFDDELDFLIIHGLLHLLGYNHENTSPEESEKMRTKEQELFLLLKGYWYA
jgi:probable rRNA maturation factor